jgi:hypothetical protein
VNVHDFLVPIGKGHRRLSRDDMCPVQHPIERDTRGFTLGAAAGSKEWFTRCFGGCLNADARRASRRDGCCSTGRFVSCCGDGSPGRRVCGCHSWIRHRGSRPIHRLRRCRCGIWIVRRHRLNRKGSGIRTSIFGGNCNCGRFAWNWAGEWIHRIVQCRWWGGCRGLGGWRGALRWFRFVGYS